MVVRDNTPAHQRRDQRNAGQLGKFLHLGGSIGIEHAATGNDQRTLGFIQHGHGFFGLGARRSGLVGGQRLVSFDVELDLGHLYIEGQIDQHRTRAAGTHQVESLLEDTWHQGWFADGNRPLGDWLGDRFDIHRLEVFFVQASTRRLTRNAKNWYRVSRRRVQAGNHVGTGWAGGANANADVAGLGTGIALSHVRSAFNVAGEHMIEAAVITHGRIQWVNCRTRNTENGTDAFFFHHRSGCVDCSHLCHL